MEQEYIQQLGNPKLLEDADADDDEIVVPSRIGPSGNESQMVGLFDKLLEIKDRFKRVDGNHVVTPITGMADIGKTVLANEIFNDSKILDCFDFRAWVIVDRKWQLKEILLAILAQVDTDIVEIIMDEDVKNIGEYLKEKLKGKRYLVVLDDVWDKQMWIQLKSLFEDDHNARKILITTRLDHVGRDANKIVKMRLLNNEKSWDLLHEKVFGEELCPYELDKFGKKIAESCDGLPLTIVAAANLLCQEERDPKYWNEAALKKNSVFIDAYEAISKIVYPSYKYMPLRLKTFSLFMGVYPQNYEIPNPNSSLCGLLRDFLSHYDGKLQMITASIF